jgi:type I thyroxine 5'-deiodinase
MMPARDLAEKNDHAGICIRKLNIKFPAVVDAMDGKVEAAYQAWPSRVYLVSRDGRVAFNSRLGELDFHAEELEAALRSALAQ